MKKTITIICKIYIFTCFSLTLIPREVGILKLKKGSHNIGGTAGIPMTYDRHEGFKLKIKLNPYYGYFVKDNMELQGSFYFDTTIVFSPEDKKVAEPVFWGLYSDLIFYFPCRKLFIPYAGFGLGWQMMDLSPFSSRLILDFPLGLLIALNSGMAIDIGFPIKWYISYRSILEKVEFPVVLGLKYVF